MALILIVDDEEMDRVLIRSLLEAAGHRLLFAADGQAAFEICRGTAIDLVITDLAMPTSSGLRFIRELREARILVPVIAISGWAKDQLDLAEEYGADYAMSKPIDGQVLLDTVDKALREARPFDPWGPGR